MRKQTRLLNIVSLLLLATLAFAACSPAPATTTAPSGTQLTATPALVLTDLQGPEDLKALFNRDAGVPRIILLVSPT